MKKALKIAVIILMTATAPAIPACYSTQYHDGDSKNWIIEQVEQGNLDKETAWELLEQEKAVTPKEK